MRADIIAALKAANINVVPVGHITRHQFVLVRPAGRDEVEAVQVIILCVNPAAHTMKDPDEGLEELATKVWETIRPIAQDVTVSGPNEYVANSLQVGTKATSPIHAAMTITAASTTRPGLN